MTSHLTPDQRIQLKAALESQRQQLDRQITTHQDGQTRVEHARALLAQDFDDAPQRATDREVDMALSDFDTRALGAVNRALKRIDAPDYGLCTDCGLDIPFDRLKAEPGAERCVACETAHEQHERKH